MFSPFGTLRQENQVWSKPGLHNKTCPQINTKQCKVLGLSHKLIDKAFHKNWKLFPKRIPNYLLRENLTYSRCFLKVTNSFVSAWPKGKKKVVKVQIRKYGEAHSALQNNANNYNQIKLSIYLISSYTFSKLV